jgi:TetR/AcrR family transcriptional regulator
MNTRRKHLPADERRAVTIEAVIDLAAVQNPSEITTAAIAHRMHLTQGALFRHFPSKEALWEAVMQWVAERLLARLDNAVRGIDAPLMALEAIFMTHVDFVVEHPGVPRIMFGELAARRDVRAQALGTSACPERYGQRLQKLLEAGKARGSLNIALDSEAAAILFIGTIQGWSCSRSWQAMSARIRRDAPRVFAIYRVGSGDAMKGLPLQRRTLALIAVIVPLLASSSTLGFDPGPLAPVAVTVANVESRAITPALFGIGTVEARYTYQIGPTFAGRVRRLDVHVGDRVRAGQVLGEMEPVDLDDRVRSQGSAFKRAEAALSEAEARQVYAQAQARRYEQLFTATRSARNWSPPSDRSCRSPMLRCPRPGKMWIGHARTVKDWSRNGAICA